MYPPYTSNKHRQQSWKRPLSLALCFPHLDCAFIFSFIFLLSRRGCRLSLWGVTTLRGFCALPQTIGTWTTSPEKEGPACVAPFRREHLKWLHLWWDRNSTSTIIHCRSFLPILPPSLQAFTSSIVLSQTSHALHRGLKPLEKRQVQSFSFLKKFFPCLITWLNLKN